MYGADSVTAKEYGRRDSTYMRQLCSAAMQENRQVAGVQLRSISGSAGRTDKSSHAAALEGFTGFY